MERGSEDRSRPFIQSRLPPARLPVTHNAQSRPDQSGLADRRSWNPRHHRSLRGRLNFLHRTYIDSFLESVGERFFSGTICFFEMASHDLSQRLLSRSPRRSAVFTVWAEAGRGDGLVLPAVLRRLRPAPSAPWARGHRVESHLSTARRPCRWPRPAIASPCRGRPDVFLFGRQRGLTAWPLGVRRRPPTPQCSEAPSLCCGAGLQANAKLTRSQREAPSPELLASCP